MKIVIAATLIVAPAHAAPVEDLFLGESSEVSRMGEVQVSAGVARRGGRVSTPLEVELGLTDEVELAASVHGPAGVHAGISRHGISARVGVGWSWQHEVMETGWCGHAAVGVSRARVALYASTEVEGDDRQAALGVSVTLGDLTPLFEIAIERELATIVAGTAWRIGDDVELAVAGAFDSERHPAVFLRVVAEIDVLSKGAR